MNLARIALIALWIHCQVQSVWATNLWFMPGDACFPVILDKQMLEGIHDSDKTMHLRCSSPNGEIYLCGWAGYETIEIQDVPAFWPTGLKEIHADLETLSQVNNHQPLGDDGKKKSGAETNHYLMFVQNRTFDVTKFQIGFRYNENWMDAFPKDGNSQNCITHRYQPYFQHAEDVTEDWGNSKRVDGLNVQFPEPDEGEGSNEFSRRFGKGPIVGSAKDLILVILPDETLRIHDSRERDKDSDSVVEIRTRGNRFFTLDADGITIHQLNRQGKRRSIPWKQGMKINEMSFDK